MAKAFDPETATMEELLCQLREDGWRVAVHNDYRHGGVDFTFWLFTHENGIYVKGEGRSDMLALQTVAKEARRVFAPSP